MQPKLWNKIPGYWKAADIRQLFVTCLLLGIWLYFLVNPEPKEQSRAIVVSIVFIGLFFTMLFVFTILNVFFPKLGLRIMSARHEIHQVRIDRDIDYLIVKLYEIGMVLESRFDDIYIFRGRYWHSDYQSFLVKDYKNYCEILCPGIVVKSLQKRIDLAKSEPKDQNAHYNRENYSNGSNCAMVVKVNSTTKAN